jgi:Zn-finger protein
MSSGSTFSSFFKTFRMHCSTRIRRFADVQDVVNNHTTTAATEYIFYSKHTRMTNFKKRTSASCECAFCTLYPVLDYRTNRYAGDEVAHQRDQKRQHTVVDRNLDEEALQSVKPLLRNETSNLASDQIPDHIEFDIKPMRVIFDHMSNEITKLKAEKEEYKKRCLEQKRITDSLSDQINDNHSLVTESSLVKELQAEIRRGRRAYRQFLDGARRTEREILQEAIQVQQRFSDQLAPML